MNKWGLLTLIIGIALAIGIVWWIRPVSGSISRGEKLYKIHCLNCHGDQGEGLGRLIPPIQGPGAMSDVDLICAIRYGKKGELEIAGQLYDGEMPPNFELDEGEIRDLVNYVRKELRKCVDCPELELIEIADVLGKCTLAQPL
jgi:cytochrome c553